MAISNTDITVTINSGKAGSNGTSGVSGTSGTSGSSGTSPSSPYAMLSHSANLACTSTTASYPVYFNTSEMKSGITHTTAGTASSRIQIDTAGTYLVMFSAIADSGTVNKHLEIWMEVDGVIVPRTNTIVQIPNANTEMTVAVSFLYRFTAGQYFEFKYYGDDAGVMMQATGTSASPARPACPSIICTVTKVSD